jgi:outer membrane protein OmpA-like peptidoglycan-associated protein
MNNQSIIMLPPQLPSTPSKKLITVATAMLLITACASAPTVPDGAAEARSRLTSLRTNPELASRAPVEIQAAELAVVAAERPQMESSMSRHLVLIADQKVEIAGAWAQSRVYEDQRADLSARSESMRLDARTQEADRARLDASNARNQASAARSDANVARSNTDFAQQQAAIAQSAASSALAVADNARDQATAARNDATAARSAANLARNDADVARAETEELQRQISELNAEITDRGLVVTLGDVLFETGNAQLRGGTPDNLNKLVTFLNRFETRTVIIEGHTDSVGSDISNMSLSQRRADAVHSYLVRQGVATSRITAHGKGEGSPVADNNSSTGRQQNRRVEVIISNQL